ncbi:MAG TPA: hypothetical protein VD994_08645 [Prosthecobacter sp.]|nr:hypothetical protein [Prosthecobacter sp.]
MEVLEKRLAPAGIVTAILSGGSLKLTGDSAENLLKIEETAPDVFRVTGLDGTMIKLGAADAAESVDINAALKGLAIDLKDGNDTLELASLSLAGNVDVKLGEGDNITAFNGVTVTGNLSVQASKGMDQVRFSAAPLEITGLTSVNLGDGDNTVEMSLMESDNRMTFGKGFAYTGGKHSDQITAAGLDLFFGALDLKMGAGSSTANFGVERLTVVGAVNFTSSEHGDTLSAFVLSASGGIDIGGNVTIKHGAGDGETWLGNHSTSLIIGGSLSITHGDAVGGHLLKIETPVFIVGGNVAITQGSGTFNTTIDAGTAIGGKLTIANGEGGGTTQINGRLLEVGGGVTITNKGGKTDTIIDVDTVDVAGAISVTTPGTGSQSTDAVSNITLAADVFQAGAVSVTNGNGNFKTELRAGAGFVDAGITIKNGNTSPDGDSPAGRTQTLIEGAWRLGGNLGITNGNGGYRNVINSDGPGTFYIGGALAITHGNLPSGLETPLEVVNEITVDDFTVMKGLTFKSGNAAVETTITATTSVRIVGQASFTSQSGDTLLRITGPRVQMGGVVLKTGAGVDDNIIDSRDLVITGGVTANFGAGDTQLHIGAVHEAGKIAIFGNVQVTALTGEDALSIVGDGRLGGAVTASFGAGPRSTISLSGNAFDGAPGLNVAGVVSYSASADTQREIYLTRGSYGAVNFTGSHFTDRFFFEDATMRGSVRLDLRAGDDAVYVSDSTLRGAFTVLGGAGEDVVAFQGTTVSGVGNRFLGPVNIQLGADDDSVHLLATTDPFESSSSFLAAVTLDGGAGANSLTIAPEVVFAKTPAIIGFPV